MLSIFRPNWYVQLCQSSPPLVTRQSNSKQTLVTTSHYTVPGMYQHGSCQVYLTQLPVFTAKHAARESRRAERICYQDLGINLSPRCCHPRGTKGCGGSAT